MICKDIFFVIKVRIANLLFVAVYVFWVLLLKLVRSFSFVFFYACSCPFVILCITEDKKLLCCPCVRRSFCVSISSFFHHFPFSPRLFTTGFILSLHFILVFFVTSFILHLPFSPRFLITSFYLPCYKFDTALFIIRCSFTLLPRIWCKQYHNLLLSRFPWD